MCIPNVYEYKEGLARWVQRGLSDVHKTKRLMHTYICVYIMTCISMYMCVYNDMNIYVYVCI